MNETKEQIDTSPIFKNRRDSAAYRRVVLNYIQQHPDGVCVTDAAVELHLNRKTVTRWIRILRSEGIQIPPLKRHETVCQVRTRTYIQTHPEGICPLTAAKELHVDYKTVQRHVLAMRSKGMNIKLLERKAVRKNEEIRK